MKNSRIYDRWFCSFRSTFPYISGTLSPICLVAYLVYRLRRQWVREEDLAKDLKLHSKQLRRTLRFFEEEKLVTRDHRREVRVLTNHVYGRGCMHFLHCDRGSCEFGTSSLPYLIPLIGDNLRWALIECPSGDHNSQFCTHAL